MQNVILEKNEAFERARILEGIIKSRMSDFRLNLSDLKQLRLLGKKCSDNIERLLD
jgi:hypothetical protein